MSKQLVGSKSTHLRFGARLFRAAAPESAGGCPRSELRREAIHGKRVQQQIQRGAQANG
jgi:hypothetical protein